MKRKVLPIILASSMVAASIPTNIFASDIDNHWAKATIQKWQDQGLINGYPDGSFKPDNSITRAEFVTLLNKVTGKNSTSAISFSDVKAGDWFYNAVAIAVAAGYTSGYEDGTFKPNANVTRAEAAVFVAKAMNLSGGSADNFADASAIPSWAKSFVGAAVSAGYIKGYTDGTFKPNDNLTRAEAVTMLNNALGKTEQVSQTEQPQQEQQQPQQDEAKKDFKPVGSSSGGGGGSSSGGSTTPDTPPNGITTADKLIEAFENGGEYTLAADLGDVVIDTQSNKEVKINCGNHTVKSLEITAANIEKITLTDSANGDGGTKITGNLTVDAPKAHMENSVAVKGNINIKAIASSTFEQLDSAKAINMDCGGKLICAGFAPTINVNAQDEVVIESTKIASLDLGDSADVKVNSEKIENLTADGANIELTSGKCEINIAQGSNVAQITTNQDNASITLSGDGEVSSLYINSNGVAVNKGDNVKVDKLYIDENVDRESCDLDALGEVEIVVSREVARVKNIKIEGDDEPRITMTLPESSATGIEYFTMFVYDEYNNEVDKVEKIERDEESFEYSLVELAETIEGNKLLKKVKVVSVPDETDGLRKGVAEQAIDFRIVKTPIKATGEMQETGTEGVYNIALSSGNNFVLADNYFIKERTYEVKIGEEQARTVVCEEDGKLVINEVAVATDAVSLKVKPIYYADNKIIIDADYSSSITVTKPNQEDDFEFEGIVMEEVEEGIEAPAAKFKIPEKYWNYAYTIRTYMTYTDEEDNVCHSVYSIHDYYGDWQSTILNSGLVPITTNLMSSTANYKKFFIEVYNITSNPENPAPMPEDKLVVRKEYDIDFSVKKEGDPISITSAIKKQEGQDNTNFKVVIESPDFHIGDIYYIYYEHVAGAPYVDTSRFEKIKEEGKLVAENDFNYEVKGLRIVKLSNISINGFNYTPFAKWDFTTSLQNRIADDEIATESITEEPTEEEPIEEQPTEEEPIEEEPIEEQPIEEEPTEEQPIEEEPTEEEPIEEQPIEEQPIEEEPTEEQPTEEQPTEKQPAEEEPIEEQ